MVPEPSPDDVIQFVGANIESVPHLEALLLVWQAAPRALSIDDIAGRVYLPGERTERLLQDLVARRWIVADAAGFTFNASSPDAPAIAHLAEQYRSNLIRIAEIIHRKAPPAVLDFARAFDLRKDKER
jgi:hypothetical protein